MLVVGDEVRVKNGIRETDENNYTFYVNSVMSGYSGRAAKIVAVTEARGNDSHPHVAYKLDIDDERYYWAEDMFEPHTFSRGDIVVVRTDLVPDERYGNEVFISSMNRFLGCYLTINKVISDERYRVENGDCYIFTKEMFVYGVKGVKEECDMETEEKVIAKFPEINVPERDDSDYIGRCISLECDLYENYSCREEEFVSYPYNTINVRKANEYSNDKKKALNDLFSRHPLWDNKTHSIVLNCELERAIEGEEVQSFFSWIRHNYFAVIEEAVMDGMKYMEIDDCYEKARRCLSAFNVLVPSERENSYINGFNYEQTREEYNKYLKMKENFDKKDNYLHIMDGFNGKFVEKEAGEKYFEVDALLRSFFSDDNFEQFVTESYAEHIKNFEDHTGIKLNGTKGKKISRVINALCKELGLDKIKDEKETVTGRVYDDGYNRRYAKFADSINPLKFSQKAIISTDRIAFLTASFGNGWASCYTIDKNNDRSNGSDNYSGCYSGGTTSYGSDETTFVFYTISNDYDGDEYVLADKINRCFFSLGNGKLIQSRNYPDGRDCGDSSLAKQFREIVQKIVAECYDIPNLWVNKKGTCECESVITYKGAGYHDHENYDDCNVSYWKGENDNTILNYEPIVLGNVTICPNCGSTTHNNECVLCYDCYNEAGITSECYNCGCGYDREEMHYIDGEYYCEDCCFYCEYHQEWEIGDCTYVEDYGDVCDYAIECESDFMTCEYCNATHYVPNMGDVIETEDGTLYCSERCAHNAGYVYCEDECKWFPEEETNFCEDCERVVWSGNWNDELGKCNECAADTEVA